MHTKMHTNPRNAEFIGSLSFSDGVRFPSPPPTKSRSNGRFFVINLAVFLHFLNSDKTAIDTSKYT